MKKIYQPGAVLCAVFFALLFPLNVRALDYTADLRSASPIPPAEKNLLTEEATHLKNVAREDHTLEGAQFDANGNLFFCDVTASRIMKLTPQNELSVVTQFENFHPSGLAFHPDGRLFVAGNSNNLTQGAIYAMRPDGSEKTTILDVSQGFIPNDLVINSNGVIYFTDFKGNMTNPAGGVYYVMPGAKTPASLVDNIANANGIALSPDEKILWIGDYGRSILFRIVLTDTGAFDRFHSTPVYYFTGRGPDSMSMDEDGNLYVAIMSQGRTLVFSPTGIPIGQILLPEREQGHNLYEASVAVNPLNRDLILVARDDKGQGANLFKSKAFAKGIKPSQPSRQAN